MVYPRPPIALSPAGSGPAILRSSDVRFTSASERNRKMASVNSHDEVGTPVARVPARMRSV